MSAALTGLRAPAKINWFLHILGRRDDGRHRLQSVMQLVDLADDIDIEVDDSGRIERLGAPELGSDDLCLRAARALQAASGSKLGCRIMLTKNIPTGAGLGGGSSDAALVLMALNRLWQLDWPRADLMRLGLQLGADVPFFLNGGSAWAEGIGERLQSVTVEPCRLLLIKPSQSVSTAAAFAHPALRRDHPALAPRTHWSLADLWRDGANDMQDVACLLAPQLLLALELLRAHTRADAPQRMSGSGSAVFGVVEEGYAGMPALPSDWFGATVRTLPRHPHDDLLQPARAQ
jgi:4-diphosphocytidyl-2-C-methyl-D-erythritol kinase